MKHYVKIMSDGKVVADALIEAESPSAAVKEALRGEGIDPGEHVNCRSTIAPIKTELEFSFECDCGTVTQHETELAGIINGPIDYRHTCPGCGANHVTRIER